MRNIRSIFVLVIILFTANLSAQNIYEFLRLDASPRAAALAGSFVSNNDDPNVVFYNPAGIKNLNGNPVSFSFIKHLMDINSASLAYSFEMEQYGRFAAGIQYINYGDFTEADEFGNELGEFGANEFALSLGYANELDENFNYGVNVKLIYSGIAEKSSMGIATDIGLQYALPSDGWVFGVSVLNLGTQLSTYFDKSEDLPLDVRLGFSKRLEKLPLTFSLSLNNLTDDKDDFSDRLSNFSFGGELRLSKAVKLRIGYDNEKRSDLKLGGSAGLAGFNMGLGILISDYNFDYAFSSMGSIGALHRVGISTQL